MLRLQLMQVVLAESHTEPGMPYPDQEGLHPDHDPPSARVGGPPEIHGHEEQQERDAHEDPPSSRGRTAEQETERRDRGEREQAGRRPGEEHTRHGGERHQRRPEPSPSPALLPRDRWVQRDGEDQPRGDELWISERGEGGHLTQRLQPEIQFSREERLRDSEQGNREGGPEYHLREPLGKSGRPQPKLAEREQQQSQHHQAVAQPRFRRVPRRQIGSRGAGAVEHCRSKAERWGEAAHRGDPALVEPVEERRTEQERCEVLLQRERIRNPGEEDQCDGGDEYEKTDFPCWQTTLPVQSMPLPQADSCWYAWEQW